MKDSKWKIDARDAELFVSTINPHFLNNAINAIYALNSLDDPECGNAILNLGTYMNGIINGISERKYWTASKEIKLIKAYLELQKLRYTNRLSYKVEDSKVDFEIPPLSILGIVDEVVEKGIASRKQGGSVNISITNISGGNTVIITHNGIGFTPEQQKNIFDTVPGFAMAYEKINRLSNGKIEIMSRNMNETAIIVFIPEGKRI